MGTALEPNNALGCTITGTNDADVICGLGSNDIMGGDNSNDTLVDHDGTGGLGNDTCTVDAGDTTSSC